MLFALLSPSVLAAQKTDSVKVKKTFFTGRDLRKGQVNWLDQQGFQTKGYEWNDPTIKLEIRKALNRRDLSYGLGIIGGSVLFTKAILSILLAPIANRNSDSGSSTNSNAAYYIGGAMVATSIGLSFDANKRVKKAKKAREKKFK